MTPRLLAVLLCALLLPPAIQRASATDPPSLISHLRILPQTTHEAHEARKRSEADAGRNADPNRARHAARLEEERTEARGAKVFADRDVYWNNDGQGQFVVLLHEVEVARPGLKVKVTIANEQSELTATSHELDGTDPSNKLTFLLNTDALKPGKYTVAATAFGADKKPVGSTGSCTFRREDKSHPAVPIPDAGIPVGVHPQDILADASWPITTGVPMPFGTVRDPQRELHLLENGRPIPAQWTVRSVWTPGTPTSARWLGLDFVAKYDGTKPREYRIVRARGESPAGGLKVEQTDKLITVETGTIRFHVRRQGFNGVDAAWLGDKELVRARDGNSKDGPFLVDEKGIVYRASDDPSAEVIIEEQGPVRVTLLARGWYVNPTLPESERKLCQFVTRITAYAGQPTIFFNHRTVITYDTTRKKLADVGFRAGMPDARRWRTGLDGNVLEGDLSTRESVWIHQERADRVRLMEAETGRRADGWMAANAAAGTVSVSLRDIWQRYPKELEADRQGVTLHFWPRHGRETFREEEQLDRRNIYKCLFAQQGRLLDMQFPKAYYDKLCEGKPKPSWDAENSVNKALRSNGCGTAIGNEFALTLASTTTGADVLTRHARLVQLSPHALAAPEWNVACHVEARMAARNDHRLPDVERWINVDYPTCMFGIAEFLGDYGMWIYGNTHNTWRQSLPELHRVWMNSHYQHVGGAWRLYFRGNTPELLRWARAQTDNFMDVGTVNYADPTLPLRFHIAGAMHHCKAFIPWGTASKDMEVRDVDAGVWGHCTDPDAFLVRYYIEGNLRAWDLYRLWGKAIHNGSLPLSGNGRETVNTFGMMLNYYRATWDPQAILHLRAAADGIHRTPLESNNNAPSFPVWNKTWAERHFDLTRDERPIAALQSWIAAGHGHVAPNCFVYQMTGDKSYVQKILDDVRNAVFLTYHNPDDVLNGFAEYRDGRGHETLMQLPNFLAAAERAGITTLEPGPGDPTICPTDTVLALDPDDRAFTVRLEAQRVVAPVVVKVIAPSGKTVGQATLDPKVKRRFTGDNAQCLTVPADGEKGLYTLQIKTMLPVLRAPLTDLPHEVAVIPAGKRFRLVGLQSGYLGLPAGRSVTLDFRAAPFGRVDVSVPGPNRIRIRDQEGKALLDTSLLEIGKRDRASVQLQSGDRLTMWSCLMASAFSMEANCTGADPGLYYSLKRDAFEPVLQASPDRP